MRETSLRIADSKPSKPLPFISNPDFDRVSSIYAFTMRGIDGRAVPLKKYKGKLCIVVNVASLTKVFTDRNYKILNKLFETYADSEGLRILAFPCNQFNNEEPGDSEDIRWFAAERGIMFDMFDKINVNCNNAHPLWKYMKATVKTGKRAVITEPFTKFIVNRYGVPTTRLGAEASMEDMVKELKPYFKQAPKTQEEAAAVLELPALVEDQRPCLGPWHFESGILKLI